MRATARAQPTPTENRAVHVRAEPRDPPDLDRFVAALLAMALAELEDERRRQPDKEE